MPRDHKEDCAITKALGNLYAKKVYCDCQPAKEDHLLTQSRLDTLKEVEKESDELFRLRMIKEADTPLGKRKNGWDILIEMKDATKTLLNTLRENEKD